MSSRRRNNTLLYRKSQILFVPYFQKNCVSAFHSFYKVTKPLKVSKVKTERTSTQCTLDLENLSFLITADKSRPQSVILRAKNGLTKIKPDRWNFSSGTLAEYASKNHACSTQPSTAKTSDRYACHLNLSHLLTILQISFKIGVSAQIFRSKYRVEA